MILGFKPEFQEPILKGTKIHTIREDKPNRWKAGNKIHFATGVRTKKYNQFKLGKCVSVQQIEITRPIWSEYLNDAVVKIDGKTLTQEQQQQLAYNDGFSNLLSFWLWFNEDFKGKIIHWTDFKY